MKKITYIIIIAIVIAGIGIWKLESGSSNIEFRSSENSNSQTLNSNFEMTETYSDQKYKFSFHYPKGYTTSTFPDTEAGDGQPADIVLVQNVSTQVGFQVHIQPIDEDISVLTVERIRKDLPNIAINNPQDVILGTGTSAGKGVAFLSDDPTFGGASREVWFVFKKNLYQIRTYASYDPLVQAVLGTWEFR